MNIINRSVIIFTSLILFNQANANGSAAISIGAKAVPVHSSLRPENLGEHSYEQIRNILEIESRVQTVSEAIDLKTQGLNYVNNISEFEYLTSCPFSNPSSAYLEAVGNFISQYVERYVNSTYDLRVLSILEGRSTLVEQAMNIKRVGLRVATDIQAFLTLIPPAVANPSDAYNDAISAFVGDNVRYSLNYYSPIYMIVEAERYTKYVDHALNVKRAGLVAVHYQRDLMELARLAFPNPSDAYRQAVDNFLRENIGRYP